MLVDWACAIVITQLWPVPATSMSRLVATPWPGESWCTLHWLLLSHCDACPLPGWANSMVDVGADDPFVDVKHLAQMMLDFCNGFC